MVRFRFSDGAAAAEAVAFGASVQPLFGCSPEQWHAAVRERVRTGRRGASAGGAAAGWCGYDARGPRVTAAGSSEGAGHGSHPGPARAPPDENCGPQPAKAAPQQQAPDAAERDRIAEVETRVAAAALGGVDFVFTVRGEVPAARRRDIMEFGSPAKLSDLRCEASGAQEWTCTKIEPAEPDWSPILASLHR
jgi:hypothetical protein